MKPRDKTAWKRSELRQLKRKRSQLGEKGALITIRNFMDKKPTRDKSGRTAEEAAKQTFTIGERAIYTILGDFYCTILEIQKNGAIIAETSGTRKLFSPSLEYDGDWGWWNQRHYPLRKDDGRFCEYTD